MSTPQNIIGKVKKMQEELAGKVRPDGTFHVTPELIQSFITQIIQKEIAVEALEKVKRQSKPESWSFKEAHTALSEIHSLPIQ